MQNLVIESTRIPWKYLMSPSTISVSCLSRWRLKVTPIDTLTFTLLSRAETDRFFSASCYNFLTIDGALKKNPNCSSQKTLFFNSKIMWCHKKSKVSRHKSQDLEVTQIKRLIPQHPKLWQSVTSQRIFLFGCDKKWCCFHLEAAGGQREMPPA